MESLLGVDLDVVCKLSENNHYEYIVIGSGVGGGIVAQQLVEENKTVLVLEKGGLLFSSHCLNVSRPHWQKHGVKGPSQDNDVVFTAVKSKIAVVEGSDPYVGGPVYCLGGRSTVWGLFSPTIDTETLREYFPLIQDELTHLYPEVLNLFCGHTIDYPRVQGAQDSQIENEEVDAKKTWLREALQDACSADSNIEMMSNDDVKVATMAAEFIAENWYTIPQGGYSTVDYLLDRLYGKNKVLTVVLNADVLYVQTTQSTSEPSSEKPPSGKPESKENNNKLPTHGHEKIPLKAVEYVAFRDELGQTRRVKAKKAVVLCAGTIGSAKIALSSNLQEHNSLVGTGLTDHEIWGIRLKTHREVHKSAKLLYYAGRHLADGDSKRERDAAQEAAKQPLKLQRMVKLHKEPALLNICLNADAFLGRSSSILQGNTHTLGDAATSDKATDNTINITLQYRAALEPENQVLNIPTRDPVIKIKRTGIYGKPHETQKRKEWQKSMGVLALAIAKNFFADLEPPILPLPPEDKNETARPSAPADPPDAAVAGTAPSPSAESTGSRGQPDLSGEAALSMKLADFGVVAHEVGTLRMQTKKGNDDGAWVVDSDLKFKNVNNLFVCDLSVFPASPPANPTPTLAALALRLGRHLLNRKESDTPQQSTTPAGEGRAESTYNPHAGQPEKKSKL